MPDTLHTDAMLERAIALAVTTHEGQRDKAGQPYVLHPLRVMLRVAPDIEAQTVAVLHDTVEDSEKGSEDRRVTFDTLHRLGFSKAVVDAVDCLTRRHGEPYAPFIERLAVNPLAVRVKLADLADNLDVARLSHVQEADVERLNRYIEARRFLLGLHMDST